MKQLAIAIAALGVCLGAEAEVKLGHMLGPHMVLQQNANVELSGTATPGAAVKVSPSWTTDVYEFKADSQGAWKGEVATPQGGFDAYEITFSDGTPLTISDVLVGEVWLAAGQSNMQMPLQGFGGCNVLGGYDEIANSADWAGMIRCYNVPMEQEWEPLESVEASWQVPEPATAQHFSATAWYFAQRLAKVLGVPVGIVNIAYGGSKVESWLPRDILEQYADVSLDPADMEKMIHYWRPMLMYNAMFAPIKGYDYAGIIWYQGCSNTSTYETYADRLATMVDHWRSELGQPDLPFYQVEIAPFDYDNPIEDGRAPYLREQQHRAAELIPNSDIICTNDLAEPFEKHNIHPGNKAAVGKRLADLALNKHYGRTEFLAGSPRYKSHRFNGSEARVAIDSPNHGICRNYMIEGFELAGADRVFHPADSVVLDWQTNEMVLSSEAVPEPVAVRYCFKDFQIGNLYGGNYLPLIPFRTDDWPPVPDSQPAN